MKTSMIQHMISATLISIVLSAPMTANAMGTVNCSEGTAKAAMTCAKGCASTATTTSTAETCLKGCGQTASANCTITMPTTDSQ